MASISFTLLALLSVVPRVVGTFGYINRLISSLPPVIPQVICSDIGRFEYTQGQSRWQDPINYLYSTRDMKYNNCASLHSNCTSVIALGGVPACQPPYVQGCSPAQFQDITSTDSSSPSDPSLSVCLSLSLSLSLYK